MDDTKVNSTISDYLPSNAGDAMRRWPEFSQPGGRGVSAQRRAWRAFYKTYWAIVPLMDEDLRRDAGMDLATYNALVHTHLEGPGGIRMKDMARNATLSTSGVTALVDRLERQGLVRRNPDPDDRRATRITLTDEGRERARVAAHVHVASIEHRFASRISEDDAVALATVLEAVEADVTSDRSG